VWRIKLIDWNDFFNMMLSYINTTSNQATNMIPGESVPLRTTPWWECAPKDDPLVRLCLQGRPPGESVPPRTTPWWECAPKDDPLSDILYKPIGYLNNHVKTHVNFKRIIIVPQDICPMIQNQLWQFFKQWG